MEVTKCLLTGVPLSTPASIDLAGGMSCTYTNELVGKVKISLQLIMQYQNKHEYKHPILAGVCRNAFELGKEPPLLTPKFVSEEINNIPYPKNLREKARYMLQYVYDKGGKDYYEYDFQSDRDYPICYAEDQNEFEHIMIFLIEKKQWLVSKNSRGWFYLGTTLSDAGIAEVEKNTSSTAKAEEIHLELDTPQAVEISDPLESLHPSVQSTSSDLFKGGHYYEAILKTYIALSNAVQDKSGLTIDNTALMRKAFSPGNPILKLSNDPGEQEGFMHLFEGAMMGIRNPKAHRVIKQTNAQRTLEWLSFASVLFRLVDEAEKV